MSELFDLTGKVALVTGGAGLIGTAVCEALDEHGATVLVGETAVNEAKRLADRLDAATAVELDITSDDSVEDAVETIHETYGDIDVLVNTAYPRNEHYGRPFEELTLADWRENIDLHLNGYFRAVYHVSQLMLETDSGGSIINVGSTYGVQAPDFSVYEGTDMTSPVEYAAIKGGVINLTRYLASYLGPHDIRANVISPGGVFDDQPTEFVAAYERRTPLQRMADPDDFKGPAVFLASDASQYVTGHNLLVDGGWTIC